MRRNTGFWILVSVMVLILLSGCRKTQTPVSVSDKNAEESMSLEFGYNETVMITETSPPTEKSPSVKSLIDAEGSSLEARIDAPEGYHRVMKQFGSFQGYLRMRSMKADKSPVLLYDGSEKANQNAHVAVFAMPVFDSDLQQCADSVIRMYAEYYYAMGTYDQIAFHLTNGFLMDYPSWKSGKRLVVSGNQTSWVKKAGEDESRETFQEYLRMVMAYAGTLSLDQECTPVEVSQIQAGDLFIRGGSPGHCVMVVDVAEDELGNKCFLLAQGYMPAQEFQVLKNPLHESDPWYYESEVIYPFTTPEYVFSEGSLKRWKGFVY